MLVNKETAESLASLGIEYLETDKEEVFEVNLSNNERNFLKSRGFYNDL